MKNIFDEIYFNLLTDIPGIKDIVIIGNSILILGDSYKILPFIQSDALITDPQYEFNNSGGGHFRKQRKASNLIRAKGLDQGFDYNRIPWGNFNSAVVFCHNDQLHDLGLKLKFQYHRSALLAWHKQNPSPMANKHYLADTEFYFHAWNKDWHPIGTHHDKFRFVVTNNGSQKQYNHPTVKPLGLMSKIMKNINADSVCDPFMGTGTTGAAAVSANKKFIGIEIDENYFEMAVNRLKNIK